MEEGEKEVGDLKRGFEKRGSLVRLGMIWGSGFRVEGGIFWVVFEIKRRVNRLDNKMGEKLTWESSRVRYQVRSCAATHLWQRDYNVCALRFMLNTHSAQPHTFKTLSINFSVLMCAFSPPHARQRIYKCVKSHIYLLKLPIHSPIYPCNFRNSTIQLISTPQKRKQYQPNITL